MNLSLSTPCAVFAFPFMGGPGAWKSALAGCLLVLFSCLLGTSMGADSCYKCGNCTGKAETQSLADIFGIIGQADEVDDYIEDGNAGAERMIAYPACGSSNSDLSGSELSDAAKGTSCMTIYVAIKDSTVVNNETSNLMLSCIILAPVADLFKTYSAMNLSDEATYRTRVNQLTTEGLIEDITSLKDEDGIANVTAGAIFCSGSNCNELPENDDVQITTTRTGYNEEYEDSTSAAYRQLKDDGDTIANGMCSSMPDSCKKSGFNGFKKKAASGNRQRRSTSYNTEVYIFLELSPGTTPSVNELKDIYSSALTAAAGSLSGDYSADITVEITEGGTTKSGSVTITSLPQIAMFPLAILGLVGTRLFH